MSFDVKTINYGPCRIIIHQFGNQSTIWQSDTDHDDSEIEVLCQTRSELELAICFENSENDQFDSCEVSLNDLNDENCQYVQTPTTAVPTTTTTASISTTTTISKTTTTTSRTTTTTKKSTTSRPGRLCPSDPVLPPQPMVIGLTFSSINFVVFLFVFVYMLLCQKSKCSVFKIWIGFFVITIIGENNSIDWV